MNESSANFTHKLPVTQTSVDKMTENITTELFDLS